MVKKKEKGYTTITVNVEIKTKEKVQALQKLLILGGNNDDVMKDDPKQTSAAITHIMNSMINDNQLKYINDIYNDYKNNIFKRSYDGRINYL